MLRRDFIKQAGIVLCGTMVPLPLLGRSINDKMKQEKTYDVIIVGGSYAGLAAGMALGRALRKVLIIDSGSPSNKQTPHSHNFLTNDGKTPHEIASLAREQVRMYETVTLLDALVTAGRKSGNVFEVEVNKSDKYIAEKLVFATGIKDTLPDIPGFADCWGISLLHCPYCHGYEVRGKKTGILANGDVGFELSTLISNWTGDLTLYTNGKSTLSQVQFEKLSQHKIAVEEKVIEMLEHTNGYIQHIQFVDGSKEAVSVLYARLPFVQHSNIPHSLGCELTTDGYLKIDAAQRTSVHGVYACGDNTTRMRTVANAVSMGTATGLMLNKEFIEEHF